MIRLVRVIGFIAREAWRFPVLGARGGNLKWHGSNSLLLQQEALGCH